MPDERHHDNRTIRPMTDREREQVLAAVRALPDEVDPRFSLNPRRVILFLYYTGAHPEVLVHPKRRHLEVREGRIQWYRPKTRRGMDMPVTAELAPWVAEFVASLREPEQHILRTLHYETASGEVRTREQDMCYLPVTRMVETVLRKKGLPGFSPRSFRHDRAKRVLDIRHDPVDVQVYVGVSPGIVATYAGARNPQVDEALKRE